MRPLLFTCLSLYFVISAGKQCPCGVTASLHPLEAVLKSVGHNEIVPNVFINVTRTAGAFDALSSFASRSRPFFAILDEAGQLVYKRDNLWLTAPKWVNATTVAAIGSYIRPETDFTRLATGNEYPNFPALFNVATGQLLTIPFNFRKRGRLHHDIEYNPHTQTFLGLVVYALHIRQKLYTVDALVEIATDGALLWKWEHRRRLPFNPAKCPKIRGSKEPPDCHHSNSLYWDLDTNLVYLNVRNMFTVYLVNKTDGNVVWGVGGAGSISVVGDNDWGPATQWHGVEPIGNDHFLAFNNNRRETSSAAVEWKLIRGNGQIAAHLVRRWPLVTWVQWMGDADQMPNGNVVVSLSMHSHVMELNASGAAVWSLKFTSPDERLSKAEFGALNVFHFERFRLRPFMEVQPLWQDVAGNRSLVVSIIIADAIRRRYHTKGTLAVYGDGQCHPLHHQTVDFHQNWGTSTVNFSIAAHHLRSVPGIIVTLTNSDGVSECLSVPI